MFEYLVTVGFHLYLSLRGWAVNGWNFKFGWTIPLTETRQSAMFRHPQPQNPNIQGKWNAAWPLKRSLLKMLHAMLNASSDDIPRPKKEKKHFLTSVSPLDYQQRLHPRACVCAYVRVCVCPRSLCAKSLSETRCACARVWFSPMKHRCPLQLHPPHPPTVTLGRRRWQWLVTVSCTPPASLHPLLPCSTFIWPHLLPLAFNAESGSPLIKVKASQCLDETERKRETEGDREGENVGELLRETDERMKSFFTFARLVCCRIQMSWRRRFTYLAPS